jgi:hypothetical protein
MAGPVLFPIESPQAVLARIQAQRTQEIASNNPILMTRAIVGQGLDQAFGNPEARRAEQIQKRVAYHLTRQPAGPGGEDDGLARLAAVRDALDEAGETEKADMIRAQMVEMAQQQLERRKLLGDIARTEGEEAREQQLHPAAIAAAQAKAVQALNEGQNYWRARGGKIERINVSAMDSLERKRLRMDGWVEGTGPTTEAEATDALGLTKPTVNNLQDSILQADQQLDMLASIAEKFDPSFFQWDTQVINWAADKLEQLGVSMSPGQAASFQKYTEFRRNSVDAFNRYIKFITGAQMSVAEAERIQEGFPDAKDGGPTKFMSRLRPVVKQLLQVKRRAEDALKSGFSLSPEQIKSCSTKGGVCVWDSMILPRVTDAEADEFLQRAMGVPPRSAGAGEDGVKDKDGWTTVPGLGRIREKPGQ